LAQGIFAQAISAVGPTSVVVASPVPAPHCEAMAACKSTLTLHNGLEMPALGFGCAFGNWADDAQWKGFTPEEAWSAVPSALRAGFKHFDGALVYGTHRILGMSLGQQFASGQMKRSDVWVTSKVFHPPVPLCLNTLGQSLDGTDASIDLKAAIRRQIETCLDELMLGYLDLLLMHWPGTWGSSNEAENRRVRKEVWEVFEEYYASGKVKAIGVSNFHQRHLESLIADTKVVPMVNQIELSPYITQDDLVSFCQSKNIIVAAWGPFGSGGTGVLSDPLVKSLSEKYNKNVGQVILRWMVQRGICVLPKSSNEGRMRSNLDIFDFELSADDLAALSALNKNQSSVSSGVPGADIA
jgi:diketogulonate reductase-like aldo/keto reductase